MTSFHQLKSPHQVHFDSVDSLIDSKIDPTATLAGGVQIMGDVAIGPYSQVSPDVLLDNSTIEAEVEIKPRTKVKDSRIGSQTYVGPNPEIIFTQIGSGNYLDQRVTTGSEDLNASITKIGDNTDIAQGTNVAAGANIGDSVRIGAKASIGTDATVTNGAVVNYKEVIPNKAVRIAKDQKLV